MTPLSKYLRSAADTGHPDYILFKCPGCRTSHALSIGEGPGPRWGYNGNPEKPTFTPSVLVTWPAVPDAEEEFKEWRTERRCHSFITDGRIQFLDDSNAHELRGWHDLAEFSDE